MERFESKKTVKVDYFDFLNAIPHDHPYNDMPCELVKKKYEEWYKNNKDSDVTIEWV